MRVTLLILCFVLLGFPRCALAQPGPTVHAKDVIIEKRLQVKGLGSNDDADVLEVDANSNLKGDVRVGKDLHVLQNITVDQGVTIAQGLTVGENLEVGGKLDIEGDLSTDNMHVKGDLEVDDNVDAHGDISFDKLNAAMSFAQRFVVKVSKTFAKRAGEAINQVARVTLVDYITYDPDDASFDINGGKVKYNPTTGLDVNDGSLRIDSTNDDKELLISNKGEMSLQRGENNESCALILKESPNVTEGIELLQVQGKSRFTQEMRIESDLILEGDFVSSGDIRSYAVETDVTEPDEASTLGQTFSATASCIGSKVIIGGGCAITGSLTTGLVLKQSAPSGKNYLCEYVQSLKEFNEFFNETIPVAIDATITATVFCATSVA